MKKEIDYINVSPETVKKIIKLIDESKDFSRENRGSGRNEAGDLNNMLEVRDALTGLLGDCSGVVVLGMEAGGGSINQPKILKAGELTIFINEHRVTKNNAEILLTPKEFDILYFLANNKGTVYTKEQIYQAIWKDEYLLDDGTIMSFIRKLRKKIENNPDDPEYIITIWGIGYKFNDRI